MLQIAAGAGIGALATLIVTWWLNRNSASRLARRETYLDLLTMLYSALRVHETAVFDHKAPLPDIIDEERIDQFNARIDIDASQQVRELAKKSFGIINRFNVSLMLRVPVDVGEDGIYVHRFDQVQGVDEYSANMRIRMSLGGVRDELKAVVDQLATRMRHELHGSEFRLRPLGHKR